LSIKVGEENKLLMWVFSSPKGSGKEFRREPKRKWKRI